MVDWSELLDAFQVEPKHFDLSGSVLLLLLVASGFLAHRMLRHGILMRFAILAAALSSLGLPGIRLLFDYQSNLCPMPLVWIAGMFPDLATNVLLMGASGEIISLASKYSDFGALLRATSLVLFIVLLVASGLLDWNSLVAIDAAISIAALSACILALASINFSTARTSAIGVPLSCGLAGAWLAANYPHLAISTNTTVIQIERALEIAALIGFITVLIVFVTIGESYSSYSNRRIQGST